MPPLDSDRAVWTHPTDYTRCQDLADLARSAGIDAIRYRSIRDPAGGANLALLSLAALAATAPTSYQTWRILLRRDRADAMSEMPRATLSLAYSTWAALDARIPPVLA